MARRLKPMQITHASRAAAGAWILVVLTASILMHVNTVMGWGTATLFAAAPAFFLVRWQQGPDQTMSQSIQKALR